MLNIERGAAAARGRRIGVFDLKAGADHIIDPINLAAFHILQRHVVNQHRHAVARKGEVVCGLRVINGENIGKAGAPAALHGNAQARAIPLSRKDFRYLRRSAFGDAEIAFFDDT